jgi:serine/threonine protein kinase
MQASEVNTSNKRVLANRYTIISNIGSGLSSQVFKVLDEQTGETKVAKIYEDSQISTFKKETQIFKMFEQLNIQTNIKFYESSIGDFTQNGQNTKKMYIIQEYGSKGCLFDALVKTKTGFTEDVCKYILLNLLNCVDALHKEGICHRDLKTENIVLVGDNYDIKLIDFGFAAKYVDKENKPKLLKKSVGTKYYAAPEILENKRYNGPKADIFSLGAILFVLMTKNFGFVEARVNNLSANVKNLLYKLIKTKQYDRYWELMDKYFNIKNLSPKFQNLYLKMVAYNPDERPTIEEIRKDEFLADIVNANEEYINYLREKMINEVEFAQQP